MGKTVLFIVTNIDSANGICVQNVAKKLLEEQLNVIVLTQDSSDAIKYRGDGIKWETVRRHWSYKPKSLCGKLEWNIRQILKRVQILLYINVWPLYAPILSYRMAKAALSIVKDNQVDIVIPVYNSIDSLLAGCYVKRKMRKLTLVPYFLDSLIGGQCPSFMREKTRYTKSYNVEKKIMRYADFAIMMNSAHRKYSEMSPKPDYMDKIIFLDLPMLQRDKNSSDCKKKTNLETCNLNFLFVGSMPRNIRSPLKILNIFSEIRNKNYRLYFIGTTDYESEIISAAKKDSRIKYIGPVSHNEAQQFMRKADYLINLGNTLPYMVPSKIFEYMSMYKPIISVKEIMEDPCDEYLKKYPYSLIIESEQDAVQRLQAFVDYCEMISEKEIQKTVEQLIKKDGDLYNNTPDAFWSLLVERIFYE